MATLASRLLRAVGLNAVPMGGLLVAGWSTGTALALYWLETVLAIPLVAARIFLHRRATRANGHYRGHFAQDSDTVEKSGSLLGEFLLYGTVFSAAHGLFLGLFLVVILPQQDAGLALDPRQLKWGVLGATAVLVIAFLRDLIGLGDRPFVWVKEEARGLLGRSVLIHLAIIGGAWLGATTGKAALFLVVFGALKFLVEIAGLWPRRGGDKPDSDEPPKILAKVVDRLSTAKPHRGGFAGYYREERARARALAEQDEQRRP